MRDFYIAKKKKKIQAEISENNVILSDQEFQFGYSQIIQSVINYLFPEFINTN